MSEADRLLEAIKGIEKLERRQAAGRFWQQLAEREARRFVRGDLTASELIGEMLRNRDKLAHWIKTGEVLRDE